MNYRVILSKTALKALDKIQPATSRRIILALEKLKEPPFDGKQLHGELEGSRRVRVGDSCELSRSRRSIM